MGTHSRALVALFVATAALDAVASASADRYIVIFKSGQTSKGITAVQQAGGKVIAVNKLGIGTVASSRGSFALTLRHSGAVVGVARNAGFKQVGSKPVRFTARAAVA